MNFNFLNRQTLFLIAVTFVLTSCKPGVEKFSDKEDDLTRFVDPFIGSAAHGHVFVGANVPFGGVQCGPCNFNKGWDWCSSYHYSDSIVKGFAHLQLSGTGCSDLGELSLMPAVGKLRINAGTQNHPELGYASRYRKSTEQVSPGYYKVSLDRYQIGVELTTTERVAFHKYTFPKASKARIIVDLDEGNDTPVETFLHQVNDSTFEGYRYSKGWAPDEREFFTLVLSKPVSDFILYDKESRISDTSGKGKNIKGFLEFSTSEEEVINLKIGISPVSMKNAMANIYSEIPGWNFSKVVADAKAKWNKELSKITIKTDDITKKKVFYTACFHTMIAPNLFNDHNGDYRGTDKKVYKDPGFTNYTLFSLWDTYRAAHPLFTLTQPERVSDMVNSMLMIYKQQGKLPVWHLRGSETNCMTGYSAVPVVVDACLKGFKDIDPQLAYEAVTTTATGDFEPGVKDLMEYGFIPADHGAESVASSMEYAISDWAISKLAHKLGKEKDAKYFAQRAKVYKAYFDSETRFMRGKLANGNWRTPFDPISAQHRVNDYCEGNAWQYLWMVPHDPEGLIELLGGDKPFVSKLDSLFSISSKLDKGASADISGLIGQYAHGNEPSHHTTYLYAYAGEQYKTADKVRNIMTNLYTDKSDGLCGNEDCGQMSAWYVFSSMGFYPVNPANGVYVFGSPLFDEVTLSLPSDKRFTVIAENNSPENIFIQSASLNDKEYTRSFITHKDILKGGTLKFIMGSEPNPYFGKNKEDRPKSIVY